MLEGVHNHEPARSLVGHSYASRLTEEEKVQVDSMNNNWVPPRHMLATLKENNPGNLSTITQVYNRIKKVKELDRGPLTEMQYFLKKLAEANYVLFERHEEDSGVIMELFWAHPNAIKLFNTLPHVVIMDCTYKTNKFQIPLLEMVGLTSTGLTYSIAFCYMTRERTPDYVWALECMKSLLADPARLPGVIVTDRELALLSVVQNIFPEATHLLCLFHINKNVEAKCKLWVDTTDFKALVMQKWNEVVYAETATQFEEEWSDMCDMCKDHPKFTSYIYDTWLVHKEKFVKAESAHASLKKMLRNGKGNLCDSWEAVDRLTIVRHNAIQASFERSINIVEHRFKSPMYKNMRGFVAKHALHLMYDEQNRFWGHGEKCGCVMKVTHGLPCACALQSMTTIPYAAVDPLWKILSWEQVPVVESQTSNSGCMPPEIEALIAHFNTLDDAGQSMLRRKLKELYCPQISSLCPPEVKIKHNQSSKERKTKPPRGQSIESTQRYLSHWEHVDNQTKEQEAKASKRKPRLTKTPKTTPTSQAPKSKNKKAMTATGSKIYLPKLPSFLWPYIHEVIDVVANGNCGYRAVAALLDLQNGQDGWPRIREELIVELTLYEKHYTCMWGYDVSH
ncbi:uncharacterized protein LOC130736031 [Lotus japonicus]|uniref:uncharacterized protein LOC130736031 n=1 Tax=Lotus japonicus TaxID=34305 RepID=UPI00258DB7AF|nr:uncharacterized protein LOC130736031 [Lotus japonicus]